VPYDVADDRIARGSDPLLLGLCELADRLRAARVAAGALETGSIDVYPVAGDDGEVMLREYHPDTPSRKMIAEWMVRANHAAARYCWERKVPVPYRHQAQTAPIPEGLDLTDRYDVYRATRFLGQTRVDLVPKRHHGLGLDAYVQVTSPLRRYLDLISQRQLSAAARGVAPPLDEDGLREALKTATSILSRAQIISAATRDYWMIRWLEGQIGESFEAVVLEDQGNRLRIELLEIGYRMHWKPEQKQRVGERIQVQLVEASARAGHVRLH
jgi:exoribonuclease-2